MKKSFNLLPPKMPNYISYERPPQLRQDGIYNEFKISISELTKEEAVEYAELMKQEFIKHWEEMTKAVKFTR